MSRHVFLADPYREAPRAAADAAQPLLDPRGARVILGAQPQGDVLVAPLAPAAGTLFAPRGACLASGTGPLVVCDTGHHRLLTWKQAPREDHTPADFVIGQPGFGDEGRNARGAVGAATFNVPSGIAIENGVLAVADAWNHRVLLWHGLPERPNQPADVVLGQADFGAGNANRGRPAPGPDTLNWCYGVAIHEGRLLVADTGNRRVLVWDAIPSCNGTPADLVLGQRDFTTRDEGAAADVGPVGMRWPHAMALSRDFLFVVDAGTSRVMGWKFLPSRNGAPCDVVLGQSGPTGAVANAGHYQPAIATLNMPYGIALHSDLLVVADTANSRLLGFDIGRLATGMPAQAVAGQAGFEQKGDNRWQPASRDSLCWPYGMALCGDVAVVADTGNNRVLLWDAP